jgi:hypothetical protein
MVRGENHRCIMINWIKYGGGWGYGSNCGRFELTNLSKCDCDIEGKNYKGWLLWDNKEKDTHGRFKTMKDAKEYANQVLIDGK